MAFWNRTSDEVLTELNSSRDGLSTAQAKLRLEEVSAFKIGGKRKSSLDLWLSQFNNPIIWLLFVSAVLSFYLDDAINALIILVILALGGILGYWQESSAADAVAKLLGLIDTQVTVLRDGQPTRVSHAAVVPGDVLEVKAGSIIPADCRLIECRELLVEESALTGESFPVEKSSDVLPADIALARRSNCLFLGTHIASGSGRAVVVQVGTQTGFGRISNRLESKAASTDFEIGLRNFGRLLVIITSLLVVAVFIVNISFHKEGMDFHKQVIESLLFALALAVGMTPQLLPAITSVVLATGAKAMARSEVIIKRLVVIENFGSMDTLCMDKTGTITSGTIELSEATDLAGVSSSAVMRLATLNACLQGSFENPIDLAIRRAVGDHLDALLKSCQKLDELPYDFRRRRLSVLIKDGTQSLVVTKGALSNVLDVCTHAEVFEQALGQRQVNIDEARSQINAQFQTWSQAGYRVLAVATKTHATNQLSKTDEADMTLVGFLTFADPLKPDIAAALTELRSAGIDLKLVTGDNSAVAGTLAKRAGFTRVNVLTGGEIHHLSAEELMSRACEVDIFAEVEPEQKEKIVLALRKSKRVVGFLGDGINDAPALHAADVGISVAGAVDVAKEAAQVVLLRSDLSVLAHGVREGRKTLANTLKYIYFAISANFGYMLSMAIATLFLPFLPLLPTQILMINLLADFPAMALATDRVDPESVQRPRRWNMGVIVRFMLTFGLIGTSSDLLTFWTLLNIFEASEPQFRTGWFTLSIITGVLIMLAIRTGRPFFMSRPGKLLVIAAVSVVAITLALPYTALGRLLELEPPTWKLLLAIAIIASLYVGALELGKLVYRRSGRLSPATGTR